MNRNCVNKGGLDLSKEVLWVSVGQRAAELRAVKIGGQKEILAQGELNPFFLHTFTQIMGQGIKNSVLDVL